MDFTINFLYSCMIIMVEMCRCSIRNEVLGTLQRRHVISHVIGAQVPLGLEIQHLIQGHSALACLPCGWTAHKECVSSLRTKGYLCMSHTHWICLKCKKHVRRNEDKVSLEFQTDQTNWPMLSWLCVIYQTSLCFWRGNRSCSFSSFAGPCVVYISNEPWPLQLFGAL